MNKKNSDELKIKPNRKKNYYKKGMIKNTDRSFKSNSFSESDNEIFSHSKEKSFDLSKIGNKAKNTKSKHMLILSNVLLSVLLVISSISFFVTSSLEWKFFKKEDVDQKESQQYEDIKVSINENVSYFLVCGLNQDLTDIIMVCCYDLNKNELNILQIPRDTYVGDITSGKINAVYKFPRDGESKIKALIRCINSKFGLPIDHYATFTIKGTEKIIDIMGGVEIKLDKDYTLIDDTTTPQQKKVFKKGKVTLDGQWATALIRHRKSFAQGDMGRLVNQRAIYSAILKQLTSASFSEITEIVTNCMDDLSTDLTLGLALGYAEKAYNLNLKKVNIMSLPGQTATINGLSCWVCHKDETVELLNQYFLPYDTKVTSADLSIIDYAEYGASYNNSYESFLQGGTLEDFDRDPEPTSTAAQTNGN